MTTQYIYNMVDTWNDGATTFTSIKMDVTDTASNASSLLMDLQVGTVSKFKVSKGGIVTADRFLGTASPSVAEVSVSNSSGARQAGMFLGFGGVLPGFTLNNTGAISWDSSASPVTGTPDTILTRRAAANLRLGAADAAGSAIAVSSVAANQFTLASSHGLTSGAAVIITGTTAPVGTSLNTLYYARSISAAVIELYLTFDTATATSGTTGIVVVTTAGTSASIRLATPFQRLSPQDFTGTDIPGQPLLINGSRGTGTGPGGSIVFQVAPAGSTGATQNALATAFQVNGSGGITGQDGAAANTLALRNGTAAQAFNVYNTYSNGGVDYERLQLVWSGNTAYINTTAAGSGGTRPLVVRTDGSSDLTLGTNATARWVVNGSAGHLLAGIDNTYDIGASSATRPRNVYVAGNTVMGGSLTVGSSGGRSIIGGGKIEINSGSTTLINQSDGVFTLSNYLASDFGRLQFGGTTSSFPALKRSSTTLQARLADDSAFAPVQGKLTTDTAYTAGDLVVYDSAGTAYKIPAVAV